MGMHVRHSAQSAGPAEDTAFSILVFTESMQKSGFFLKKKPPSMRS
jgi:hypothetical protein